MEDKIADALDMRPLGDVDLTEGTDPNEVLARGGHMGDAWYKNWSEEMKVNNPMHNKETAKKVSESKKGKPTWNKGIPNPEQAERMKGDGNPTRRFPEKHNFKNNSYVAGRKWYNNGEKNIYLYDHEEVPPGYKRGMRYVARQRKKTG